MADTSEILLAYSKNPPNQREMPGADAQHLEESRVCADTVRAYLKLAPDGTVLDWSFTGNTSTVTTACAAVYGESLVGQPADAAFSHGYAYVAGLIGTDLTPKRRYAGVLAVLATRNALHAFRGDGLRDDFSDVL